jgi:hypothetical protein
MTPETDENGSDNAQRAFPTIAGANQIPNNLESIGDKVQSAPAPPRSAEDRCETQHSNSRIP